MRIVLNFFLVCLVFSFSSCKVLRPSLMLKTPKNYVFEKAADSLAKLDYRLAPTDAIQFRVFSNDGFRLIDLTTSGTNNFVSSISETVDKDGYLKLPIIGKVKLLGMTLREAEVELEKRYEEYYVKPYVQLKITNKRVMVFPGTGGAGKVVEIANNNTTVFAALALAGGITEDGKSYKIKLIRRGTDNKPIVYLIDLSTIQGIAAGNTIVLANDIIYVEPRGRFLQRLITETAPYISLLSSAILIYSLFTR